MHSKETLNILYTSSDYYSTFLGVSMYSLFMNNCDIREINVYAILNNVSDTNVKKLKHIAKEFNRNLIIINAAYIDKKLEEKKIPKWRDSYATYYKIFFLEAIDINVERLLYLDCDTLVIGSLKQIPDYDLHNNYAGAVLGALRINKFTQLLDIKDDEPYFNAGVLLIDVNKWKKARIEERIISTIENQGGKYHSVDQDLINICLKGHIAIMEPKYNYMTPHRVYCDKDFLSVLKSIFYYDCDELKMARENPIILHMYRFLGMSPWDKNTLHPDKEIWNYYLNLSPWYDYIKSYSKNQNLSFRTERLLFNILPKRLFLFIFIKFTGFLAVRKQTNYLKPN